MSKWNFWATFAVNGSSEDTGHTEPAGYQVARHIEKRLAECGLSSIDFDNWRDAGYSIDYSIEGFRVYVIITYLGIHNQDWLLCCTSDSGFLDRIRGRSDFQAIRTLTKLVDEILYADPMFRDIRWYVNGWRGRGDEEWKAHPSFGNDVIT